MHFFCTGKTSGLNIKVLFPKLFIKRRKTDNIVDNKK